MRPLKYPSEHAELSALVKICHPTRRVRPIEAFFAYPHIVAVGPQDRAARIIGYTSFAIYPSPTGRRVMFGDDLGVHPFHRGRGLGRDLFNERLRIAKEVGVNLFIGACAPDNKAMLAIFKATATREGMFMPNFYTEETPVRDALLFYVEI